MRVSLCMDLGEDFGLFSLFSTEPHYVKGNFCYGKINAYVEL